MTQKLSVNWTWINNDRNIITFIFFNQAYSKLLRFRKAGTEWCGGAGETHWATCHNNKSPCFLDLNDRSKFLLAYLK